jgi:ketose-bisphosphate aldolase
MVQAAAQEGRAVLAFNVSTLEMAQGIVAAATELNRPVILQCNRGGLAHFGGSGPEAISPSQARDGIPIAAATLSALARQSSVPIALHLDHADGLDDLKAAIEVGFTSLMLDGSTLDFPAHIALGRRAHDLAAGAGLPLEAELGHVSGTEAGVTIAEASLTNPLDADRFVEATEVEMLAVSIGNVHGRAPRNASLDLERLDLIRAAVDVPLVLHGASGIPPDQVMEAVKRGIAKINVGSGIQRAYAVGLAEELAASTATPSAGDAARALHSGRRAVGDYARDLLSAPHIAGGAID